MGIRDGIRRVYDGSCPAINVVEEMHHFIRGLVSKQYGEVVADDTTILYGGSCKASNAAELFANPDVDGGLIGGASLVQEEFCNIVKAL